MRKVIAVIFILLLLVGLAYAGDAKKEDKDVLKDDSTTVDKTKETLKEIDKGISARDTSADIAKYDVLKEKDKITISKTDTVKDKKIEHTKTKLVMDEKTARSIDVDNDGKFGYLRKVDGQVVDIKVVTLKELTTGIDATFSEVIINGFSGTYSVTQTVNIGNVTTPFAVSGNNVTIVANVPGVSLYQAITETNKSTYPKTSPLALYPLNGNANDVSGNNKNAEAVNAVSWYSTGGVFNGVSSYITLPAIAFGNNSGTLAARYKSSNASKPQQIIVGRYYGGTSLGIDYVAPLTQYYQVAWESATRRNSNVLLNSGEHTLLLTYNGSYVTLYLDGDIINSGSLASTLSYESAKWSIGRATDNYYFVGNISNVLIDNDVWSYSDARAYHIGYTGSAISINSPTGTRYPLLSSNQTIASVSSVSSINLLSNTNESKTITYTAYFTQDTTEITDSHTALVQTVNVTHYTPTVADSGIIIPYEILDGYDGTATFQTNNNNATISRNETAFVISTGYLAAGSTYYYNVQIPNPVEEMLWYDWNPDNETCNAKVQIGNSTPYTTWNITTFNVTDGATYKIVYAANKTLISQARANNGQASIIITGLPDGEYWLVEIVGISSYVAPTNVIITFVPTSLIIISYMHLRRKRSGR